MTCINVVRIGLIAALILVQGCDDRPSDEIALSPLPGVPHLVLGDDASDVIRVLRALDRNVYRVYDTEDYTASEDRWGFERMVEWRGARCRLIVGIIFSRRPLARGILARIYCRYESKSSDLLPLIETLAERFGANDASCDSVLIRRHGPMAEMMFCERDDAPPPAQGVAVVNYIASLVWFRYPSDTWLTAE